jgi:UDP-N-acetylglucosamine 2-epimerase (non-hydrolysing)
VLVQGDTSTAFAGALAAFYKNIPVGHIEAGLRTWNRKSPWPEESNRKMIASLADLHFSPTETNKQNLIKEGVSPEDIFLTGNTVIDALKMALSKIDRGLRLPVSEQFGNSDQRLILITGHRRENLGEGLRNVFTSIGHLAKSNPRVIFVFPVHLNPVVRKQVDEILRPLNLENLHLIDPLAYPEFVWLMRRSYFIITDSGGIQEEATALGKPVLVTRTTTERSEGVQCGTTRVVGVNSGDIIEASELLLEKDEEYQKMTGVSNPYGTGDASAKIVDALKQYLG